MHFQMGTKPIVAFLDYGLFKSLLHGHWKLYSFFVYLQLQSQLYAMNAVKGTAGAP